VVWSCEQQQVRNRGKRQQTLRFDRAKKACHNLASLLIETKNDAAMFFNNQQPISVGVNVIAQLPQ
jgi:hypothetical protein